MGKEKLNKYDESLSADIGPRVHEEGASTKVMLATTTNIAEELMKDKGWLELVHCTEKKKMQEMDAGEVHERAKKHGGMWLHAFEEVHTVARGYARNADARLVMLMHWLEATDAKHRHGGNMVLYHKVWMAEPDADNSFWYWLDYGKGKDYEHPDCSREKLEAMCIHYCDHAERQDFLVDVTEDGLLKYKNQKDDALIDTHWSAKPASEQNEEDRTFIFVVSASLRMYTHKKERGHFQHSSFLAGGAVMGAGQIEVSNGKLLSIVPHSGHYRPMAEDFMKLVQLLANTGIDMSQCMVGAVKPEKHTPEWEEMKKKKANQKAKKEAEAKEVAEHKSTKPADYTGGAAASDGGGVPVFWLSFAAFSFAAGFMVAKNLK